MTVVKWVYAFKKRLHMKRLRYFLFIFFNFSINPIFSQGDFANGMKIGEVNSHSAIVWTRLTNGPAKFTRSEKEDRT